MPQWATMLIDTLIAAFLTGAGGVAGWSAIKLIGHGNRLSKIETELHALDGRAQRQEVAHNALATSIGEVNVTLATLEERSATTTTTVNRIDARLEQLFQPKAEARARVRAAQD